jgi:hypothetical protein
MPKRGRPSTYTLAAAAAICERIAEGESLVAICKDGDMPGYSTVMQWLDRHPKFADSYARARSHQAERYAQETIDIADAATPEDATVAKLRVDARKWVAAKLLPKKYGTERVEHAGDAEAPIPIVIKRVNRPDG